MSYAYPRTTGASSLPSFTPRKTSKVSNFVNDAWDSLPAGTKQWISQASTAYRPGRSLRTSDLKTLAFRAAKWLFTVTNAVILLWVYTLWWGERTVFDEHLRACAWENWETWPPGATPHHVAFIADPQLVDPHTYPGRPWPLSTLTVKYTDQYMRRSFSGIQEYFVPDSVLFLGDLFDGGREWATRTSSSPEAQYKKIKDPFWRKEYARFVKIFMKPLAKMTSPPADGRGRKMIASLPGNHDLGFGNGIQESVRARFQTYFGHSNRVDVIGNHTFVSVDTVSLSAMDQPDPVTGGSSTAAGATDWHKRPIWKDADEFLDTMPVHRAYAETQELRMLQNQSEGPIFDYRVVDAVDKSIHSNPQSEPVGFPTILLTHVPLYRKPGTPCGPLREHYPPSSPGQEVEEDEPNALKIAGGYQYQNVLTSTISNELVSKAGPNIVQIYSGDDHDYCEVSHREFSGAPREITVKSFSWAMGVRRPGFLLTSLWNPIDPQTSKPAQDGSGPTIQNHLCLLPDQLAVFIHYGCILGVSLVVLLARTVYRVLYAADSLPTNGSVLPLSERRPYLSRHKYQSSSTSSSSLSLAGSLASRGGITASARYPSPGLHHDGYRGLDYDGVNWKGKIPYRQLPVVGLRPTAILIGGEFYRSVKGVVYVVLTVYFFLIWRW
ncbi:hypothetical protein NUU61_000141 [Penicillium alfredii]|uniref:Calcineurin-like phosphoesterase domain-containing protein n=1 Tax=Penicillium alfredii TaxID=1506179 RepID=A0A9W9GAA1_9EURO|nr:uncharacterized protein NUU61_000141 [Penicillium alfredii]KAJ5114382.1 hypothetical protein NUU61_000141 [Penicillium alfredii]